MGSLGMRRRDTIGSQYFWSIGDRSNRPVQAFFAIRTWVGDTEESKMSWLRFANGGAIESSIITDLGKGKLRSEMRWREELMSDSSAVSLMTGMYSVVLKYILRRRPL